MQEIHANAADPLAGRAVEKEKEKDKAATFHYKLKIQSDDISLAASYYPGKPDTTTPVAPIALYSGSIGVITACS